VVTKLKILLMTQWFDPEPTFKGLLFAKKLQESGNQVEVITGFPNYPGGKIYEGYKLSLYKREEIDGVIIHRVPLYPSHDGSAIKRIWNYVSFFITSFICGLFKVTKPDVIYSYHPPLTTALSAMSLSLFKRRPFVVDIQDLWPDTLAATGMLNNKKILGVVGWVCKLVYSRASRIIVLSDGFKKILQERGVPSSKVEVVYNWCDEQALRNPDPCELSLPNNGKRNLVFAGNLGNAQGLPAIINAAELLERKNVPVNFVLIGDGISKADSLQYVQDNDLKSVFFLPRVPMNQVGSLLRSADMLLVHLTDDPLFSITIPSRTQACMAVGKPIVMGVAGDAARIVESAECGVICIPNSAKSLAMGVEKLVSKPDQELQAMGMNAEVFYENNMSVKNGIAEIQRVFESVL